LGTHPYGHRIAVVQKRRAPLGQHFGRDKEKCGLGEGAPETPRKRDPGPNSWEHKNVGGKLRERGKTEMGKRKTLEGPPEM